MSNSLPLHSSPKNQTINKRNFITNQDIPSFILKTYSILENNTYADVICWTKNGEGFIVKNIKQLSQQVLPKYFRHGNYTSFVRQLNMYDFHKTRMENHQNCFKNPIFQRDAKHLLKQVKRKDYKLNKILKQQNQSQKDAYVQQSGDNIRNKQTKANIFGKQPGKAFLESSNSFYKQWMQNLGNLESIFEGNLSNLGNARVSNDENLLNCLETLYKSKRANNSMMYVMGQFEKNWSTQLSKIEFESKSIHSKVTKTIEKSEAFIFSTFGNLPNFDAKPGQLKQNMHLDNNKRVCETTHSLKSISIL